MTKSLSVIATPAESPRFDVTSVAGLATVAGFLLRGSASVAAISPAAPIAIPIMALLAFYEFKKRSSRAAIAGQPRGPAPPAPSVRREQQEVAVAILEKGRELGLSEVEIILENDTGIAAGVRLPKALNVDLRLKAGRNTKTTIRAKYRDDPLQGLPAKASNGTRYVKNGHG